ncbi:MAG: trigger factor family protein [Lawsonibacter sp.]
MGYPKMEIVEVGKDGLTFKALVSVRPEVKLGTYKGLTAPKDLKVTDKDIENELEALHRAGHPSGERGAQGPEGRYRRHRLRGL